MSTKCPESIEELEELEALLPLCRKELLEQAQARIDAGTATSERDAARQIAEETGRKPETIRKAIQREKLGTVSPLARFKSEVLESELPVLAYFTMQGCPPCKQLIPIVKEIASVFKGELILTVLDAEEDREVFEKYKITSVPQIAVFSGGKAHWIKGRTDQKIRVALDEFLATGEIPEEIPPRAQAKVNELLKDRPEIDVEMTTRIKGALSLVRETLLKLPMGWENRGGTPVVTLRGAKRGFDRYPDQYPENITPEQKLVWDTYFLSREVANMAGHFNPMTRYLSERLPEELPENWSTERKKLEGLKIKQAE